MHAIWLSIMIGEILFLISGDILYSTLNRSLEMILIDAKMMEATGHTNANTMRENVMIAMTSR